MTLAISGIGGPGEVVGSSGVVGAVEAADPLALAVLDEWTLPGTSYGTGPVVIDAPRSRVLALARRYSQAVVHLIDVSDRQNLVLLGAAKMPSSVDTYSQPALIESSQVLFVQDSQADDMSAVNLSPFPTGRLNKAASDAPMAEGGYPGHAWLLDDGATVVCTNNDQLRLWGWSGSAFTQRGIYSAAYGALIRATKYDENHIILHPVNGVNVIEMIDVTDRDSPVSDWSQSHSWNHTFASNVIAAFPGYIVIPSGSSLKLIDATDGSLADTIATPLSGTIACRSDGDTLIAFDANECVAADMTDPLNPEFGEPVAFTTPISTANEMYAAYDEAFGLAAFMSATAYNVNITTNLKLIGVGPAPS